MIRSSNSLIKVVGVLVGLIVSSCVEPISFETEPTGGQLIVNGTLTNSSEPCEVSLKRTDQNEDFPLPLSNAQITLVSDDGQQEPFYEQAAGSYRTKGIIQGKPGDTYHLIIALPDGKTYRSQPETMPRIIGTDSAYYEVVREEVVSGSGILFKDRLLKAYIDSRVPPSDSPIYLKWEVETVYSVTTVIKSPLGDMIIQCFFYEYPNAQEILLFDRQSSAVTDELQRHLVATREIDYSFLERHYFNVIQSSITRQAHNYWAQVGELSNRTGSIFDTPPGTIRGNIYNVNNEKEPVLGYFGASLVDTARFFLNRRNIRFNIGSTCQCAVCTDLPGDRPDRPYYW